MNSNEIKEYNIIDYETITNRQRLKIDEQK
jgi:hypothetical protein